MVEVINHGICTLFDIWHFIPTALDRIVRLSGGRPMDRALAGPGLMAGGQEPAKRLVHRLADPEHLRIIADHLSVVVQRQAATPGSLRGTERSICCCSSG